MATAVPVTTPPNATAPAGAAASTGAASAAIAPIPTPHSLLLTTNIPPIYTLAHPSENSYSSIGGGTSALDSLSRLTPGGFTTNGTWLHAPYLTRHGEVDPGLRQRHQLFLSQKRYDRLLRDAWLIVNGGNNTLWSAISRRLEGDINGGGWETI